ncbi:MAG: hypothetical protein H7Z14_15500 [Anaerolineae bacterium]|nr:hypothetical protein [Phycisphaerae bacterium]
MSEKTADVAAAAKDIDREPQTKGPKPTKELATDRIKTPKQIDILRVYGTLGVEGKPVTNNDVAKVIELTGSTVGLCNAFFVANDFLTRIDGGFAPAPELVQFARAYQWSPETAAMKLAPLVERSWFARRLFPKLQFRDLPEEEALADLADEAQAAPRYKPQLGTLLDYMALTGICARENGSLRLVKPVEQQNGKMDLEHERIPPSTQLPALTQQTLSVSPKSHQPERGGIHFEFSVHVSQSELEAWQPERVAEFFKGVAAVISAKGKSGQEVRA